MGGNDPRGGLEARILGRMAVDTGVRRTARGAGWWVRTVAMVVLPVVIGVAGFRRTDYVPVGLVLWLLASIGAIYVVHPDTLGWRLSLYGRMSAGPDLGPSHAWQVWARLSGLVLLGSCILGVLVYAPAQPPRNACTVGSDGAVVCGTPQDAPAGG